MRGQNCDGRRLVGLGRDRGGSANAGGAGEEVGILDCERSQSKMRRQYAKSLRPNGSGWLAALARGNFDDAPQLIRGAVD